MQDPIRPGHSNAKVSGEADPRQRFQAEMEKGKKSAGLYQQC
jgi:hypothetical protein